MSYQQGTNAGDPYAPFYYWDPQSNNWAFDYNSYYATYGYPAAGGAPPSSGGASSSAGYPSMYAQSSQAPHPPSGYYPPSSASAAASSAPTEDKPRKDKKPAAGPKDADGNPLAGSLQRGQKRTTVVKSGPDGLYEDPTLLEWDPAHKRLFVGDLGNDVTDAVLAQAFQKYASFSRARVVRKKHDNKSRGYGFVAFSNPEDYLKAWKEMNGKYIGSRPCRLKAADSHIEKKDIGYRQDKILANNVKHQEFKSKYKMGGAIGGTLRRHGVGKAWASK